MPTKCTAHGCENVTNTVRLPSFKHPQRQTAEQKETANKLRRAHLSVLWQSPEDCRLYDLERQQIEKAVTDGRELRVCRDHYPLFAYVDDNGLQKQHDFSITPVTHHEKGELKQRKAARTTSAKLEDIVAQQRLHLEQAELLNVSQHEQIEKLKEESAHLKRILAALDLSHSNEIRMLEERIVGLELVNVPKITMEWLLDCDNDSRVKGLSGFTSKRLLVLFLSLCYTSNLHSTYNPKDSEVPQFIRDAMTAEGLFGADHSDIDETLVDMEVDYVYPDPILKTQTGPPPKLSFQDALALTLFQYRQAVSYSLLGHLFGIAETTANDRFKTMTKLLHDAFTVPEGDGFCSLYPQDFNEQAFQSPAWVNAKMKAFKSPDFHKAVFVLDCTDIYTQTPSSTILKKIFFQTTNTIRRLRL